MEMQFIKGKESSFIWKMRLEPEKYLYIVLFRE